MYSGIMRKDDNRTSKSLSGRSVTYKLSGFIIKTGNTDDGLLFFIVFSASYGSNFFILSARITDFEEKQIPLKKLYFSLCRSIERFYR